MSSIQKQVDQILANQNAGDSYSTCMARARKTLGRGPLSEAVLDLTEAIRLKPDHVEAYNQRGLVYRRLGKYAEAIEDYSEATRIVPDFRDAYVNRAYAYKKQGDQSQSGR